MVITLSTIALILSALALPLIRSGNSDFGTQRHQKILKELHYQQHHYANSRIHHIHFDPDHYKLVLVNGQPRSTLRAMAGSNRQTLAAINAAFFTAAGKNVGAFITPTARQQPRSLPRSGRGVIGWTQRQGQSRIYFDRLVMSTGKDWQSTLQPSSKQDRWWEGVDYLVTGAPLLIHNSKALNLTQEKLLPAFINRRYARSAICIDQSNNIHWFLVTGADSWTYALGMKHGLSLAQLQEFAQSMGCVHALNLDGGYSSSIWLYGDIISAIPWLPQRKIASALLLQRK